MIFSENPFPFFRRALGLQEAFRLAELAEATLIKVKSPGEKRA